MHLLSDFIEPLRHDAPPWLWVGLTATLVMAAALLITRLVRLLAKRATKNRSIPGLIVRSTRNPVSVVFILTALSVQWQTSPDSLPLISSVRHITSVAWIGAMTWLLLRCVSVTRDSIIQLNPFDAADNLRARSMLTQARVLSRTLQLTIGVIGMAIALMTFPEVRQVGASLLASAGIAGLAVGLAAKPLLGNLLAGIQIALTQPIRLDDVLVVEGEWGRVEEITGTYVVVAIWDQRRLVLPLQYFIEKPFQNWTRNSSDILGTVMLWVDYRLPVDPIRAEMTRLCEQDIDWDGRVGIVQVTDTSESTMQLRVLLSSPDSGRNFDLRCRIREGLISFIGREYPAYLPHLRAELIDRVPPAPPAAQAPIEQDSSPTPTAPQPG